jgi:large subunit ribosomal protein L29
MAKKKIDTLKSLSSKELIQRVSETEKDLFQMRIKHATGQLEKTSMLWRSRKELARMKTFLTQKGKAE